MKNLKKYKIATLYITILLFSKINFSQTNNVSWYGPGFNGKLTANGEVYSQDSLTAASPSLAFNTLVKITNIKNNKSVIVRINDRGPFEMYKNGKLIRPLKPHPKRKFDLSKAAFNKIANLNKGIITIRYKILN